MALERWLVNNSDTCNGEIVTLCTQYHRVGRLCKEEGARCIIHYKVDISQEQYTDMLTYSGEFMESRLVLTKECFTNYLTV